VLELLALVGDGTEAIPGVPGIGLKCATLILLKFENLTGALSAAKQSTLTSVNLIGKKRCMAMADKQVVKGIKLGIRVIHLERNSNECDGLCDWSPRLSWRQMVAGLLGRRRYSQARA